MHAGQNIKLWQNYMSGWVEPFQDSNTSQLGHTGRVERRWQGVWTASESWRV